MASKMGSGEEFDKIMSLSKQAYVSSTTVPAETSPDLSIRARGKLIRFDLRLLAI